MSEARSAIIFAEDRKAFERWLRANDRDTTGSQTPAEYRLALAKLSVLAPRNVRVN